jgi:hypothetical protein
LTTREIKFFKNQINPELHIFLAFVAATSWSHISIILGKAKTSIQRVLASS